MGTTYTAWDGNEYDWPPPKGWYQAIDNRWWAPDTGPAAMGQGAVPEDATRQMEQNAEIVNPAAVATDQAAENDLPAWAMPQKTTTYSILPGEEPNNEAPTTTGSDPFGMGPGPNNQMLVILVAAGVGLLLLIGLIWIFASGGDDTATQTTQASTTAPQTTTTSIAPVRIILTAESEEAFQDALDDNNLRLDGVSSERLANTFCNAANKLNNSSEYADMKLAAARDQLALYETNPASYPPESRLTADNIDTLIDATVSNLCPDVATKLNVK